MRAAITAATAVLCAFAFAGSAAQAEGALYAGSRAAAASFNYFDGYSKEPAQKACEQKEAGPCHFVSTIYDGTCIATAYDSTLRIYSDTGPTLDVLEHAFKLCTVLGILPCKEGLDICDGAPGEPGVKSELFGLPLDDHPERHALAGLDDLHFTLWGLLKSDINDPMNSALLWQAVALVLFSSLAIIIFRRSRQQGPETPPPLPNIGLHDPPFATTPPASEPRIDEHIARVRETPPPGPLAPPPPSDSPPNLSAIIPEPEPQPPPRVIDTAAAIRALKIAAAYEEEVRDGSLLDELTIKNTQTTLALAAKQLDKAAAADPHAVLELENGELTQERLRALILMKEALTWSALGKTSKALGIAEEATRADPFCSLAWYTLGSLHYDERNKQQTIDALEKVIELDPDDIDALKLLDRAENLSGAEIATFKVVNARDKTLDGVATGIRIARIPIMIIAFPYVLLFKIGRHFYRLWQDPWYWMR